MERFLDLATIHGSTPATGALTAPKSARCAWPLQLNLWPRDYESHPTQNTSRRPKKVSVKPCGLGLNAKNKTNHRRFKRGQMGVHSFWMFLAWKRSLSIYLFTITALSITIRTARQLVFCSTHSRIKGCRKSPRPKWRKCPLSWVMWAKGQTPSATARNQPQPQRSGAGSDVRPFGSHGAGLRDLRVAGEAPGGAERLQGAGVRRVSGWGCCRLRGPGEQGWVNRFCSSPGILCWFVVGSGFEGKRTPPWFGGFLRAVAQRSSGVAVFRSGAAHQLRPGGSGECCAFRTSRV